jgi:hypothetical protein
MHGFNNWFVLNESKQQIENLGFPPVIASIFQAEFGKKAYYIAKWYKEYYAPMTGTDDWWKNHADYSATSRQPNLQNIIDLYNALPNKEAYANVLEKMGYTTNNISTADDYELKEIKDELKKDIKTKLQKVGATFFKSPFITAIINGQANPKNYEKMSFEDASDKYETSQLFLKSKPLITYPDGMKWIDAGKKCHLVGNQMGNCGSVGAMSIQPDATMIVLFDKDNKPLVATTYTKSNNVLTGVQGPGHAQSEEKYDPYVVDLIQKLGADYKYEKQGSNKRLALKSLLGQDADSLEKLDSEGKEYFKFIKDGKAHYTNGNRIITDEQLDDIQQQIRSGKVRYGAQMVDDREQLAVAALMAPSQFDLKFIGLPQIFKKNI